MRRAIFSGSTFKRDIGYARAVVDGDWAFVSGTTGLDYATMTISDGVATQTEQCLRNIGAAPPAATMIVAGLSDPRMKIEIEVTARRRASLQEQPT
jgi:enamine deaminase RidA (YjgF/YER057c/UK114 family)